VLQQPDVPMLPRTNLRMLRDCAGGLLYFLSRISISRRARVLTRGGQPRRAARYPRPPATRGGLERNVASWAWPPGPRQQSYVVPRNVSRTAFG